MKTLKRSKNDKVFLGVCGGLGEYFNVDPVWFRLGFALFALTSHGIGLFFYVLTALVMPEDKNETEEEKNTVEKLADEATQKIEKEIKKADKACRKKTNATQVLLGLIFIVLGLSVLLRDVFNFDLAKLWPVGFIVLGIAILGRK